LESFVQALRTEPDFDIKYYDVAACWLAEGENSQGWQAARCLALDLLSDMEELDQPEVNVHSAVLPHLVSASKYVQHLTGLDVCKGLPTGLRLQTILPAAQAVGSKAPSAPSPTPGSITYHSPRLKSASLHGWAYSSLAEGLWLMSAGDHDEEQATSTSIKVQDASQPFTVMAHSQALVLADKAMELSQSWNM
jgi:hypothetical protein